MVTAFLAALRRRLIPPLRIAPKGLALDPVR